MKIFHIILLLLEIACIGVGIYLYYIYFHANKIETFYHISNYVCIGLMVFLVIIGIIKWKACNDEIFSLEPLLIDIPTYIGVIYISIRYICRFIRLLFTSFLESQSSDGLIMFGSLFGLLLISLFSLAGASRKK